MYSAAEIRFFSDREHVIKQNLANDNRFCDKLLSEERLFVVDRNSQNDLFLRGQQIPLDMALNNACLPYEWLTLELNRECTKLATYECTKLLSPKDIKKYPQQSLSYNYIIEKIHMHVEQKGIWSLSEDRINYLQTFFDLYRFLENKSLREVVKNKNDMIKEYGNDAIKFWIGIEHQIEVVEEGFRNYFIPKDRNDTQRIFTFDYLSVMKNVLWAFISGFEPACSTNLHYNVKDDSQFFIFYIQVRINGEVIFLPYRFTEIQQIRIWQALFERANNYLFTKDSLSMSSIRDIENQALPIIKGFLDAYKNRCIEESVITRSMRVPKKEGSKKTTIRQIECKSFNYNSNLGKIIEEKTINYNSSTSIKTGREVTPHTRRACMSYVWVLEKNVKQGEIWHDIKEFRTKMYVKVLRHRRSSQVKGGHDVRGSIRCN